jgi:8-oxo-dGTP pyrophosphatase MutT (NUDIX family)
MSYRNFALRRVPGATSWLPSLFVAVVQPADDGSVLVGRMAGSTAAPGRWQLPGGTVDPPPPGHLMGVEALRRHAALEVVEELGADPGSSQALSYWSVVRCENGNVGVLFRAQPRPAQVLHDQFRVLRRAEAAAGRTAELDEIVLVGREEELDGMEPAADFLRPAVRHFFGQDIVATW